VQRSTKYPVTATLSDAATQLTLICELELALAEAPEGALGASVSGVTMLAVFE
jgi:hypothetical protein